MQIEDQLVHKEETWINNSSNNTKEWMMARVVIWEMIWVMTLIIMNMMLEMARISD
jgi:hypothetical protein